MYRGSDRALLLHKINNNVKVMKHNHTNNVSEQDHKGPLRTTDDHTDDHARLWNTRREVNIYQ